jgi:hypothetical protein
MAGHKTCQRAAPIWRRFYLTGFMGFYGKCPQCRFSDSHSIANHPPDSGTLRGENRLKTPYSVMGSKKIG